MSDYQYYGYVSSERLLQYVTGIFAKAGMAQQEAAMVADNLVFADRSGMQSHGVIRPM